MYTQASNKAVQKYCKANYCPLPGKIDTKKHTKVE